jgi:iron-sulfur cluster assembly protein
MGSPTAKGAEHVLAITETAATAIKGLAASQELPDEGGVRIATREGAEVEDPGTLKLSLAEGPAEDDAVVEEHGAQVFLAPHAVSYLDDKLLDASIEGSQARFVLGEQN